MTGEKDLDKLLKTMKPKLNFGDYVFCNVSDIKSVNINDIISIFNKAQRLVKKILICIGLILSLIFTPGQKKGRPDGAI